MRAAECRSCGGVSECGLHREGAVRAAVVAGMVPIDPFLGGGAYAGRGLAYALTKFRVIYDRPN